MLWSGFRIGESLPVCVFGHLALDLARPLGCELERAPRHYEEADAERRLAAVRRHVAQERTRSGSASPQPSAYRKMSKERVARSRAPFQDGALGVRDARLLHARQRDGEGSSIERGMRPSRFARHKELSGFPRDISSHNLPAAPQQPTTKLPERREPCGSNYPAPMFGLKLKAGTNSRLLLHGTLRGAIVRQQETHVDRSFPTTFLTTYLPHHT